MHGTRNPLPEYGEIKQIKLNSYISHQKIISEIDEQFLYPIYPDEFELILIYEKYKATYITLNMTEFDYKELKECLLDNSKFEAEKDSWPYSLIWKSYKFVPISIEEVLYDKK